VQHIEL